MFREARDRMSPPSPFDRLLKIEEVKEITTLSIRTIFVLAATGVLPRVKIGRASRYRLSDVMQLVEHGTSRDD